MSFIGISILKAMQLLNLLDVKILALPLPSLSLGKTTMKWPAPYKAYWSLAYGVLLYAQAYKLLHASPYNYIQIVVQFNIVEAELLTMKSHQTHLFWLSFWLQDYILVYCH